MSQKAARLGDVGSGHGCFPPTTIIGGSPDIIINGRPAARVGDPLVPHGCGTCPPHGRAIAEGSSTVIFNGKPAARTGDSIDCGGMIISGSGDVIIGNTGLTVPDQPCLEAAKKAGAPLVQTYPEKPKLLPKVIETDWLLVNRLAASHSSEQPLLSLSSPPLVSKVNYVNSSDTQTAQLTVTVEYDNAIKERVVGSTVSLSGPTQVRQQTNTVGMVNFLKLPPGQYTVEVTQGLLTPITASVILISNKNTQQTIYFPCTHRDQAYDIAVYMVDEIRRNVVSNEAQRILEDNQYDSISEFKKWEDESSQLGFFEKIIRGMARPDFVQLEISARIAALAQWTGLVMQDSDWDHKPKIAEKFSTAGNSQRWHHKYQDFEYYYDIWSNIHYGYVGIAVGFSESMLLDGAGLEQIGSDLYKGQWPTDRATSNGDGLRRYDDSTDYLSVQLGINLYQRYPDATQLTPDVLINEITTVPYKIEQGSKLRHRCER